MEGGFLPEPSEALPPRHASASTWPPAAGQRSTQPAPQAQQARVQRPAAAAAAAAAWDGGEPPDLELEAQGGCSRCPSLTFRSDWLKAFGVVLCNSCSKAERLISKSTAKQTYSVSDGDLAKLGSLRKANPHKADWTPMQLFLESQVVRMAHDKFGGEEQLQEHQRTRADAKLQSKLRRREEEKAKEQKEAARLARIKQRIEGERAAAAAGGATAEASEEEEI